MSVAPAPRSVDDTVALLAARDYVADRSLATAVFLALELGRPLLLEGEAGVGKTEVAKVLAEGLDRRLIRLQCYEGLDLASAVYEWNYARQMIEIRLAQSAQEVEVRATGEPLSPAERERLAADVFSERFLVKRPLLEALESQPGGAPVLLIDELDRADEPFEAYLLELLSDFQVTIPELGVVRAPEPPIVVITSNRTREIHDALKRRCFYHWIDYPDLGRELEILRRKVPEAAERLRAEVARFVQALRARDLFKLPGIAESLDWTRALVALHRSTLDPEVARQTLGLLLKSQDDLAAVRVEEILAELPAP